jgi:hypothetical protein
LAAALVVTRGFECEGSVEVEAGVTS